MFLFAAIECDEDRTKAKKLYSKYKNLMYREAYNILGNVAEAEDSVSEAFLRIINNLHKIDEEKHLETASFMVRICTNVAKSKITQIAQRLDYEEPLDDNIHKSDSSFVPENLVISKESTDMLTDIISSLKPAYRDVIILRYYYSCGIDEICEILNQKKDTVKKQLTRAKKLIGEEYEKQNKKEKEQC